MNTITAVQLKLAFPETKNSCSNHSTKGIGEADKKVAGTTSHNQATKRFTQSEMERLQKARVFVLNHLHQDLSFTQVQRVAAMNRKKLDDAFALLFGWKVMPFIKKTKMETALFLVRNTDKTIKEISSIVGYRYSTNFCTSFKKYFGFTVNSVKHLPDQKP